MKNVDFEEALEQTGFGRFNWFLILVCGLCTFGVNNEVYSISYVLPAAECDLNLNNYTKGILTSSNFIGIMSSCCFWGYLSDKKGRKYVIITNLLLAFLCSIIACLTPSFWGFTIFRLFNGIFISGSSSIIFAYFGEFQGKTHRSKSMALMTTFISFALIYLPSFAWFLLPQKVDINVAGLHLNTWRLFMGITSLPNLIIALIFLKLPESPKFLYYSGRTVESLDVLKRIYSVNNSGNSDFLVESLREEVAQIQTSNNFLMDIARQIGRLFWPPHLKYALTACVLQAGVFAVSSGLYLWYPDIVNQLSRTNRSNLTICQVLSLSNLRNFEINCNERSLDSDIFVQNIIIGFAYLFGYLSWSFVVRFIGNRNFFFLCMLVSATALLLINFVTEKILIDVLFVILLMLPGICVSVINLTVVDTIPTHLCGMAVSVTMTAGRLGSILSSSVVGITLEWNCPLTFYMYALNLLGCLGLAFIFPRKPL